jgi:hypothetical protein
MAASLLLGILMTMRETIAQTYIMGKTPVYLQGMIFGIYFGTSQQGQLLLQPAYGWVMDAVGIPAVFHVAALLSLAVAVITLLVAKKL